MNCERIAIPGGGFAIVCGVRRGRRTSCVHCGQPATLLCDGPPAAALAPHATCDRPLCRRCAIHVPPDHDYCRAHRQAAAAAAAQLRLAL